jgi:hypothetical protein
MLNKYQAGDFLHDRRVKIPQPDYGDTNMSNLVINDLPESAKLDSDALATLFGGISFGWIAPYRKTPASGPGIAGQFVSINNTVTNNFITQLNPTNLAVIGNDNNTNIISIAPATFANTIGSDPLQG